MATRTLTQEQKNIVNADDGAFLVIAPPGSGKTTVVTERVLRFAATDAEFRVLALTFTNKAANNIIGRLGESNSSNLGRVTAQTIHGFCHDALRHYGQLIGLADFTIYDKDADRLAVLREGLQQERLPVSSDERKLRDLLEAIGRLKRDLIPPSEAPQTIEDAGVALDAAYEAYDNMLRRYGALDFDDLLFHGHRLLANEQQVRELYRTIFRYVMIDEAQDTSLAQYEIVRSMFCDPGHGNVMLVADADQSIFQFAGADVAHLLRFEREFKAQRWGLTQNFRCSKAIVTAANELIQNNPDRLTTGAEMTSAVLAPGLIIAASHADAEDEGKAAVDYVEQFLRQGLPREALYADEDGAVEPEQVCILARARYLLDDVRRELEVRSIEYQFSTGRDVAVFESKEFAAISAAMRWRINANDGLAKRSLARALQIHPEAWSASKSLSDTFESLPDDLQNVLAPLRASTNAAAVGAFIESVDAYVSTIEDEDAQSAASADLALLRERWSGIQPDEGDDALARVESEIALLGSAKINGPGVRVLTIHAAKGLEFRAVVLVGMNEGGFPHYRSTSESALIEERRSAYVAFTRAERVLALLRFRSQTTRYGTRKTQQESRFMAEAGVTMERQS